MQRQHGMTFIGILITLVAVVMLSTVVVKVIPVYLQYFSIRESMKGLNAISQSSLSGDSFSDVAVLKSSLNKRLEINGSEPLQDNQLTIVPDGTNKYMVKLKYQVVKPLIYNISLLFDFNETEEVVIGSEN